MADKHIQEPTPEQHKAFHELIDKLPLYSETFADHTECQRRVQSLRSMLESQGRISEQHRQQVQKIAHERDKAMMAVRAHQAQLDHAYECKECTSTKPCPRRSELNAVAVIAHSLAMEGMAS